MKEDKKVKKLDKSNKEIKEGKVSKAIINLKCPSCGAMVNTDESHGTCVYCGNSLVTTEIATETSPISDYQPDVKTPSATEAYIKHYYEDYEWYSFGQTASFEIPKIDRLIEKLTVVSADDYKVWEIAFDSLSFKVEKKFEMLAILFAEIKEAYKDDKSEAHGDFRVYKAIAEKVAEQEKTISNELNKYINRAKEYGGSDFSDLDYLKKMTTIQKKFTDFEVKENLNEYEDIQKVDQEFEQNYSEEMAKKGIFVEENYLKGLQLIEEKNYFEALNILYTIKHYKDAEKLIENCNELFIMEDVINYKNNMFFIPKELNKTKIYRINVNEHQVERKTLVNNFSSFVTNYGNHFYYLNNKMILNKFDLITGRKKPLNIKKNLGVFDFNGNNVYLINQSVKKSRKKTEIVRNLYKLDLITDTTEKLSSNLVNELYRTPFEKHGFIEGSLVYTRKNPNIVNNNLFVKDLENEGPEKLIERNVYKVLNVVGDRIYYIIGSERKQVLISIKKDGTGRYEMPLFVKNILFESFGWLYFRVGDKYNNALYKARLDGKEIKRVIVGIDAFVKFDEEYIYYLYKNELRRVQQNGLNDELLHDYVRSVVSVSKDEIYLISQDSANVKSLYLITPNDNVGAYKLAHNISNARKANEKELYFTTEINRSVFKGKNKKMSIVNERNLYKCDLETKEIKFMTKLVKRKGYLSKIIYTLIIVTLLFVLYWINKQ